VEAVSQAMRTTRTLRANRRGIAQAVESDRSVRQHVRASRRFRTCFAKPLAERGGGRVLDGAVEPGENGCLSAGAGLSAVSAVLCKTGLELNSYYLSEEDGWQPELDDDPAQNSIRARAGLC